MFYNLFTFSCTKLLLFQPKCAASCRKEWVGFVVNGGCMGEELAVESGERKRGGDVESHLRPEWSAVCDGALASQAQLLIFFVDGLYLLFGEFHLVFQALHFAIHLFNEAVSFAAAAVEKAQIVFVGDDLLL